MGTAFFDYNRTIVGYHGTSAGKAEQIVRTQRFSPSRNSHDWLGHGVYFWEHAPKQALWWARRRYGPDAAVVASMIRLANCLDLLDPENAIGLRAFHNELDATARADGKSLPSNHNTKKYRDCFVLEAYYAHSERTGDRIDTGRGVYVPTPGQTSIGGGGVRLWDRSWLTLDAHIQICVRSAACILGTWPVLAW
jgi:hypothetical protein